MLNGIRNIRSFGFRPSSDRIDNGIVLGQVGSAKRKDVLIDLRNF